MSFFRGLKPSHKPTLMLVGLGNPGHAYEPTRHNAGFRALDHLAKRLNAPAPKKRFEALASEVDDGQTRIVLIWPQTFMNDSGRSVQKFMSWYKQQPCHVLVMYDDLDLPVGKLRLRQNGGAGTHNGMRSLVAHLGGGDFPRIRIGIGSVTPGKETKDFVLGVPLPSEKRALSQAEEAASEAAICWMRQGIDIAMNRYNTFTVAE